MDIFELRPSPGAADALVRKKTRSAAAHRSRPKVRASARPAVGMSLQRFSCPCGCGRNGWFSQPRSLRTPIPDPAMLDPAIS
jgi:hypothetical protein